jgi:hypothetical protein
MSHFMSSMPAAGLIEMPPVSKHVTPLPTTRERCRSRHVPRHVSRRSRQQLQPSGLDRVNERVGLRGTGSGKANVHYVSLGKG